MAEYGQQQQQQQGERVDRAQALIARAKDPNWQGPYVDYKELDILRKFLTTSHKLMSRKRGGTSAQQQKALKIAVKRARFLALVPYSGT